MEVTTDPDRIIALAPMFGHASSRSAVRAARIDRHAVVVAIAEEIDMMQQVDRRRVAAYEAVAQPYLEACRAQGVSMLGLREAHARIVELAEQFLPPTVDRGTTHVDAQ